MSDATPQFDSLLVIGRGEADAPDPELFTAKARATVRYADPASWIIATAIARAISAVRASVDDAAHEVGVVVMSDQGPTEAMDAIALAANEKQSSPLRFPAANPGAMVGVTCIALGFRGPTLNLVNSPADGVQPALAICQGWLQRRMARFMLIATCTSTVGQCRCARAVLLAAQGAAATEDRMTPAVARWLMQVE